MWYCDLLPSGCSALSLPHLAPACRPGRWPALNRPYGTWECWVKCPVSTSITKRIKNLLKGLGLQGRISLFVNSEPYFWILFQKLCIALLRNKSERAPNLIIMSRKASENGDHHSLTIDIRYLVTWKAIETRWNIVTRPKIEVSRSMLPFFRGDLPTSQALGKNQED